MLISLLMSSLCSIATKQTNYHYGWSFIDYCTYHLYVITIFEVHKQLSLWYHYLVGALLVIISLLLMDLKLLINHLQWWLSPAPPVLVLHLWASRRCDGAFGGENGIYTTKMVINNGAVRQFIPFYTILYHFIPLYTTINMIKWYKMTVGIPNYLFDCDYFILYEQW